MCPWLHDEGRESIWLRDDEGCGYMCHDYIDGLVQERRNSIANAWSYVFLALTHRHDDEGDGCVCDHAMLRKVIDVLVILWLLNIDKAHGCICDYIILKVMDVPVI